MEVFSKLADKIKSGKMLMQLTSTAHYVGRAQNTEELSKPQI